jgi:IS30 family transposase
MCRNRGQRGYRFKQAEAEAQARQAIRSKPRKLTAPLRRRIEAKSHECIYQMIWQDKPDGGDLWRCLRRRGKCYNKRAGKNAGRCMIPNRTDISERPAIVVRKTRLEGWEGDTVVRSAQHRPKHSKVVQGISFAAP